MRSARRWHFYLGCFFAPMVLYFSLSGAWQAVRFNDVPKEHPSAWRRWLHEWSKPHRDSTLPGRDAKVAHSAAFSILALAMGLGLAVTTLLGLSMAWQIPSRRRQVILCVAGGLAVAIGLLFL